MKIFLEQFNLNESKSKHESSSVFDLKNDVTRITDDQVRPIISQSFPDLGFYWCILNPNGMNEEPKYGTGDAIDDILDIYKDLKEGYEHYKNSNYGEAVYVWTYSYEIHWGEHLVELQNMLYDLIYQYLE